MKMKMNMLDLSVNDRIVQRKGKRKKRSDVDNEKERTRTETKTDQMDMKESVTGRTIRKDTDTV